MSTTWGAVCRPKHGQSISGDTYVVHEEPGTSLLAAVIDGLGGGQEASRASQGAATILRAHHSLPLDRQIRLAHDALHQTRGAVIGLMRFDFKTWQMQYVGVGNIGVYAMSQQTIKPISKNGILGYRLPSLLQLNYTYNSGDTFVLYSDGISTRFSLDNKLDFSLAPQVLAEKILADYGKSNDDATVVVLRL